MSQFIKVFDDALSEDVCQALITKFEELVNNTSGNDYGEKYNGVASRKDIARYFHADAPELALLVNNALNSHIQQYLDEHPALEFNRFYSSIVKVQRTEPKGGFHSWHSEIGSDTATSTRCLAWMFYLNTTQDGEGTTEFLEQGVKLQPKAGRLVFFPADWTHTHRGNPVYTSSKYIATGWYSFS